MFFIFKIQNDDTVLDSLFPKEEDKTPTKLIKPLPGKYLTNQPDIWRCNEIKLFKDFGKVSLFISIPVFFRQ